MRMYDIIHKKRDGEALTERELYFFVNGYVKGEIPDYQVSALLMAIYFVGMNKEETALLTMLMANSGDIVDLSAIIGIKVDKHSTGGVGDKTSLIAGPIAAACGVKIAKMSGRGLGYTGGTIDKMESIPNLKTDLNRDEFIDIVKKTGISVIGQSGNLCPADKKLYALRDVTATVESIPLIASSIMSKKIAAGSDKIVLDVKTGDGAFMKTLDDSIKLAETMVDIGESVGRKTVALITDMDRPLGKNVGNSLEIIEVVETLRGKGPQDLEELCIILAANMIYLGEAAKTMEIATQMAREAIDNGTALKKLIEMVEAQGGASEYIENTELFELASEKYSVLAPATGYIQRFKAESCGIAAMVLGAGRETKESIIDFGAGISLCKNVGDFVQKGEEIAVLYSSSQEKNTAAKEIILAAVHIGEKAPINRSSVYKRIEKV